MKAFKWPSRLPAQIDNRMVDDSVSKEQGRRNAHQIHQGTLQQRVRRIQLKGLQAVLCNQQQSTGSRAFLEPTAQMWCAGAGAGLLHWNACT